MSSSQPNLRSILNELPHILHMCSTEERELIDILINNKGINEISDIIFDAILRRANNVYKSISDSEKVQFIRILSPRFSNNRNLYLVNFSQESFSKIIDKNFSDSELEFIDSIYLYPMDTDLDKTEVDRFTSTHFRNIRFLIRSPKNDEETKIYREISKLILINNGFDNMNYYDKARIMELVFDRCSEHIKNKIEMANPVRKDKINTILGTELETKVWYFISRNISEEHLEYLESIKFYSK